METPANDHVGTDRASQQDGTTAERDAGGVAAPLPEAAQRALAEAAERRVERDWLADDIARAPELNGRGGLDPVRYEDWEIAGRAVDF